MPGQFLEIHGKLSSVVAIVAIGVDMRKRRTQVYNRLYTKQTGDYCYYCGDLMEHMDHCPPVKWVDQLGPDHEAFKRSEFVTVPSCAECNYVLGAKDLFTLKERVTFIYHHLEITQWKLRMQEPHDPDTVQEEFSGRLREEVKNHIFQQVRAWKRFEFAKRKAK
jgi:hypothetical protein